MCYLVINFSDMFSFFVLVVMMSFFLIIVYCDNYFFVIIVLCEFYSFCLQFFVLPYHV